MRKKGVELSLTTIIVAIICIIVLVVVVYIFTQRSGIFGKQLAGPQCTERGAGAHCATSCGDGFYLVYAPGCTDENGKEPGPCCVPIAPG